MEESPYKWSGGSRKGDYVKQKHGVKMKTQEWWCCRRKSDMNSHGELLPDMQSSSKAVHTLTPVELINHRKKSFQVV
jgi:hypothetical protein